MRKTKRLIAIGDIHGCYYTMLDLFKKLEYNSSYDTLVFLGDYIDRGKYSFEVVSALMDLQHQVGDDKCICLRGNHEQFAIDCNGELSNDWYCNGGIHTYYSYQENGCEITNHISWFKSLPYIYDTPEFTFCHAGLTHPRISDNTPYDLLWGRSWIKNDETPREKQAIFGHTPSKNRQPYQTKTGDICIDCGCVFNGNLCALIFHETGENEFVLVPKSDKDKY